MSELITTDPPVLVLEESNSKDLMTEQATGISMKPTHEKAKKGINGYCYTDGVLMHTDVNTLGDPIQRSVVPKG